MELTGLVMSNLHLDIHLGLNHGNAFNFNSPHAMDSSSLASAGSSSTSSDYGPFTPTSGRSASPRSNSMDFGSSFDMPNSYSFDLIPPPSAVSTSFSMGSSFTSDGSEFLLSNMPATPTRTRVKTERSALSLNGCDDHARVTPSHALAMCPFTENTLTSTFSSTPGYHHTWDASPMWVHPQSPVNFLLPVSPKGAHRPLDQIKTTSVALQKAQRRQPQTRAARARCKKEEQPGGKKTKCVPGTGKRHYCQEPGCGKSFRRPEHLKRHHHSIHGTDGFGSVEMWTCIIPDCPKYNNDPFNRKDNVISHSNKHLKNDSKCARVMLITDPVQREELRQYVDKLQAGRRKKSKGAGPGEE